MDEATEPLIAVIGHPIAGHPAQFALEKAFDHLSLDYRVASFDVSPGRLATALDGVDVLQFRGAYLDDSVRQAAATWNSTAARAANAPEAVVAADKHDQPADQAGQPTADNDPAGIDFRWLSNDCDCLGRSGESDAAMAPSILFPSAEERRAIINQVRAHFDERQCPLPVIFVLGEHSTRPDSPPTLQRIEAADLIVIPEVVDDQSSSSGVSERSRSSRQSRMSTRPFRVDDWPSGDRLLIDLRKAADPFANEVEHQVLLDRGYTIFTARQKLIGGLAGCIQRWTGREVAHEILADAIEEYTAV